MNDFVVRIDTARLNAKQAGALAAAIQGAVLKELGNLDLATAESAEGGAEAAGLSLGSVLFHPEWRGMWIRHLKDLQGPRQQVLTVQTR